MIKYVTGDATDPQRTGCDAILHVCNDVFAWGSGFVLAVSKRWPTPERRFRKERLGLGQCQINEVEQGLWVVNMIAQHEYASSLSPVALDYPSLAVCLNDVRAWSKGAWDDKVAFHAPRLGAGLAGGDWSIIEKYLDATLPDVTIYDLPLRTRKARR